jgi:hypothetical protein
MRVWRIGCREQAAQRRNINESDVICGRDLGSHNTSSTTQGYAARRKWQYDLRPQRRQASRINRKIVSLTIDCAEPR